METYDGFPEVFTEVNPSVYCTNNTNDIDDVNNIDRKYCSNDCMFCHELIDDQDDTCYDNTSTNEVCIIDSIGDHNFSHDCTSVMEECIDDI